MPVNMDPSKKRRRVSREDGQTQETVQMNTVTPPPSPEFGEETAVDRERDLAEAELRSLWDATEVIDMDKA